MNDPLKQLQIFLLGGDRREVELWRRWKERGLAVNLVGFEEYSGLTDDGVSGDDAAGRVLIAPLSGISAGGTVKALFSASKTITILPYLEEPAAPVMLLAGSVDPSVRRMITEKTKLFCTLEDEELLLLNAVPTAEGAVQKAMELSPLTLHRSRAVVVGLGRCGWALARTLQGMGAFVTAVVRRRESAALALTCGLKAFYFSEIFSAVGEADFVFNTVPAPVVNADVLAEMKKDTLVLDLAEAPGGVDYEAAGEMGMTAVLLPGLPGKVAPKTAGRILDHVYSRLLSEGLAEAKKREG